MTDKLVIGGHEFQSRFILGSGKFSLEMMKAVIEHGEAEIVTLALASCKLQAVKRTY